MELKDQIRIAREAAGLTKEELAGKLNVSKQSITWWEDGEHRPKILRIRKIEEVLNVHLDLSERGSATALDSDKKSLSVDPEILRLAVAIGRLPRKQRDAIETLAFMGESKMLGTLSQSEENPSVTRVNNGKSKKTFSSIIDATAPPKTAGEFQYIEKRKPRNAGVTANPKTTKPRLSKAS